MSFIRLLQTWTSASKSTQAVLEANTSPRHWLFTHCDAVLWLCLALTFMIKSNHINFIYRALFIHEHVAQSATCSIIAHSFGSSSSGNLNRCSTCPSLTNEPDSLFPLLSLFWIIIYRSSPVCSLLSNNNTKTVTSKILFQCQCQPLKSAWYALKTPTAHFHAQRLIMYSSKSSVCIIIISTL